MPNPIRVLIVDDSAVARRAVLEALSKDPEIEVVGYATDGNVARERIKELNPEVLILDIEMPESDGFDLLKVLRSDYPMIRTIMFSNLTHRGALQTIEALSLGASDYVAKPTSIPGKGYGEGIQRVAAELLPKIKQFRPGLSLVMEPKREKSQKPSAPPLKHDLRKIPAIPKIVAIGISTGGPEALSLFLPKLSAAFPVPIVIVQHMPPVFTRLLAERLDWNSKIKVVEGFEGMVLEPGVAYIAPGNYHMVVEQKEGSVAISINQKEPENSCRPAADVLFRSVATVYGPHALGVIMTGMGKDGLVGLRAMKAEGALVFAQDQESSVIWGMPSFVVQEGLADRVISLSQMAPAIEGTVASRMIGNHGW